MNEMTHAMLAAVGVLTGFLSGLLGIGGALIVVPALYFLLPMLGIATAEVPHVAVATSLAVMVPTAAMAAWAQHRRGALDLPTWKRLAPGMALGAAIGAALALRLDGAVLAWLFATQSLYYGCGLAGRSGPMRRRSLGPLLIAWTARWPCGLVGLLAAGFSACAGMGAGSLVVPYLNGRGLPLRVATATSGALNLCIALAGVAWFVCASAWQPRPQAAPCWPAVTLIAAAALPAVFGGVALAHKLPIALFRRVLGCVFVIGALVLMVRTGLG